MKSEVKAGQKMREAWDGRPLPLDPACSRACLSVRLEQAIFSLFTTFATSCKSLRLPIVITWYCKGKDHGSILLELNIRYVQFAIRPEKKKKSKEKKKNLTHKFILDKN